MENTLSVAKMFNNLYRTENGINMDQMRMHKMMYLVQRESLMYDKVPLFDAQFQGWKFGPVLVEVRNEYNTNNMFQSAPATPSKRAQELVKSVYLRYNRLSSWQLSTLSHGEFSWKHSREGLDTDANGSVSLKLADMRLDAMRELLRRKSSPAVG